MKNLTFSGQEVLALCILLIVILLFVIVSFRNYLHWKARSIQKQGKNSNANDHFTLSTRVKHKSIGVEQFSTIFFRLGLLFTVSFVFIAFNWTTTIDEFQERQIIEYDIDEVIQQIPNTYKKPKPRPKMPEIKIMADDVIEEDSLDFLPMDIDPDESIFSDPEPIKKEEFIEKSYPLPEIKEEGPPLIIAQYMPRFPGCEDLEMPAKEKEQCAKQKLLQYIYSKLNYPAIARENEIEGQVVIRFVVNKVGRLEDITILRDIGGGCGQAAKEVIQGMNDMEEAWKPGRQQGRPVKVLYTIPIKFVLEG